MTHTTESGATDLLPRRPRHRRRARRAPDPVHHTRHALLLHGHRRASLHGHRRASARSELLHTPPRASEPPPTVATMTTARTRPRISLLITDLDNTLWDWFEAWHASFSALIHEVSRMSGIPVSTLEAESRAVHQRRGTTEYSHLLNELPSLLALTPEPMKEYDQAIHSQNAARKKTTHLYPGVMATLQRLRTKGVPIVGYTESIAFWTEWRMKTTGLDGVLDALYSSPDHDLPDGVSFEAMRTLPAEEYGLKKTSHRHVPAGAEKPSPSILRGILTDFGGNEESSVYVGDSLIKDVVMAQEVGVLDVHAAYGVSQDLPGYELLRRVTHWTDAIVQREREAATTAGHVAPTYSLGRSFGELLDLFDFAKER